MLNLQKLTLPRTGNPPKETRDLRRKSGELSTVIVASILLFIFFKNGS